MPAKKILAAWAVALSFLFLVILIYSPSFQGGYKFDDNIHIADNPFFNNNTSINLQDMKGAVLGHYPNYLYRPLSKLTLYLDYVLGERSALVQRVTNLVLHLINGVLVYVVLIKTSAFLCSEKVDRAKLALLTSVWILLPLNVSAVSYIVQRMTLLSSFFSLLAIYLYYVTVKLSLLTRLILILFVSILGFLCKENSVVALLLILLVGYLRPNRDQLYKYIMVVVFLGLALFFYKLDSYLIGYNSRDFDLSERVMTQSRVIIWYLKNLFVPNYLDLSVYHDDFTVSRGLLNPVTTLLSIFTLFVIFVSALVVKNKLIKLGVLWFFIAHSVESTILPLELVFEHRNYLPSVGILLVVYALIKNIQYKRIMLMYFVVILYYSYSSYQYNKYWGGEFDQLLIRAYLKPNSVRENGSVAYIYATNAEKNTSKKEIYYSQAKKFFKRAEVASNYGFSTQIGYLILIIKNKDENMLPEFDRILEAIKNKKMDASTLNAIYNFNQCVIEQECKISEKQFLRFFETIVDNNEFKWAYYKSNFFLDLAEYYKSIGRLNEAILLSKKAVEIDSNNISAYVELSQYFLEAKDIEAYKKTVDLIRKKDVLGLYVK